MIRLSDAAAREVRDALSEKGITDYGLRVQVVGGGCEGFLYDLLFQDAPDPEDLVFESGGVKLFVARKVLKVVDGLEIDHGKTTNGVGFLFKNPSARSTCSCGASFGT